MDEVNPIPVFGIRKIKEFSFVVNEGLFESNKEVQVKFQHNTAYYAETNFIDLTLRVFYSYEEDIAPKTFLVDFHVQNIFEVPNLKQYFIENVGFVLPKNLMVSMVSVAISHTRSLMAHNVAGTVYQESIIPIVNPVAVTEAFYPVMLKNTNIEIINEQPIKKVRNRKST